MFEDIEDYFLAAKVLERVREGKKKFTPAPKCGPNLA
jgi:predicted DNA-binding protein